MVYVNGSYNGAVYFTCDDCPFCVGWEYRLQAAKEGGYEPQFEYCCCDKTGDWGEFYMTGYCPDAWLVEQYQKKKGERRTGRAYRRMSGKRMDKRRREKAKYSYEMGVWHRNGGGYLRRNHRSNAKSYYKKYSNRKNRRDNSEPTGQKGAYKRKFDLWWTLY